MAKKGGQVQLQVDIDNDEDWDKLVEREGLILVDIYSDWCGPCSGMTGNLRKAKLEFGGEILTLAAAKCDHITCLERFRNKSRPTWMFISNKRMIRLLFGTNAPKLMRVLADEVQKTKVSIESSFPRDGIDFDELTEEEQAIVDEENAIKEEAERIETEERERLIMERRDEIATNLLDPLKEYNFVMLWPHIGNEGMTQIFNAIKETIMTVAGKPVKVQLKDEDVQEMMYYSSWEYSDIELQELKREECTGLLFQAPMGDDESDPISVFRKKLYGSTESPPGAEDSLAVKLSTTIKVKIEKPPEEPTEDEDAPPVVVEEEEEMEVIIPALYVPENDKCKVIAMRILFPLITLKHDLPEPEPIPPHLIVAFDAFKKNEALQVATEWPEGTMRLGFFTSADPAEAVLIAKTVDQYERISVPTLEAKLVIQVSKKKSEPLLSYSVLGPMYVSPNTVVGEKECAQFFPEDYDEPEPELEPEPEKKKKKKKKGGSKISITSPSSDDKSSEESGEQGESAEGIEEEEVEEEEEEAEGDDDDDYDPLAGYVEPTDLIIEVPQPTVEAPAEEAAPTEEDKATSTT